MKFRSAKHRMRFYLVAYICVFAVLAVLGRYTALRIGFIKPPATEIQTFSTDLTYFDMPRMTVAVNGSQGTTKIRLDLSLEVSKKDMRYVERFQPRMTDRLTSYFEHADPILLTSVKSMPLLRADILRQINAVGMPVPVHDLLFREMVIM